MRETGSAMGKVIEVSVFSGNECFRKEALAALSPYYMVKISGNSDGALDELLAQPPSTAIIDTELPPRGGLDLIRKLRANAALNLVPVLVIADSKNKDSLKGAQHAAVDANLSRPLLKSMFLKTVSNLANSAVERSWEKLPPLQATALRESVSIFKKSFGNVREGQPLMIADVEKSCEPLIEAVSSNQIGGILQGVRDHDDYTYVHSLRVSIHLSLLGHAMGIRGDDLQTLTVGGLVHDIGKSLVPVEILNKPAKLDNKEWPLMRDHVLNSEEVIDRTPEIGHGIRIIALQHHEKLDGNGYPKGLKGRQLNDLARMAAIVDIYGALNDRRSYKPAFTAEKALKIMREMEGELDMNLVKLFSESLLDTAHQGE